MKVLILSCSTGGGHNAAGRAVKQALELRGHQAVMMDPYELKSRELAKTVGDVYVKTVQHVPRVFGGAYQLGNLVRKIPGKSPVYLANIRMANRLWHYFTEGGFDAVIMPHLFPAEIITYMKSHGMPVPVSVFVATDYTCIPFTEETDCDYYIIPSEDLIPEFVSWGIRKDRLVPLGIPVGPDFTGVPDKGEVKRRLELDEETHYLVLSGGSMGAGDMNRLVGLLAGYLERRPDWEVIVICGSNRELHRELETEYGENSRIRLIGYTDHMADYMRSSDIFMTKPGGLSSTEAAAVGVPIVHISPIPGCENRNLEYFRSRGLSLAVLEEGEIEEVLSRLEKEEVRSQMVQRQRQCINGKAAEDICRFLEDKIGSGC